MTHQQKVKRVILWVHICTYPSETIGDSSRHLKLKVRASGNWHQQGERIYMYKINIHTWEDNVNRSNKCVYYGPSALSETIGNSSSHPRREPQTTDTPEEYTNIHTLSRRRQRKQEQQVCLLWTTCTQCTVRNHWRFITPPKGGSFRQLTPEEFTCLFY